MNKKTVQMSPICKAWSRFKTGKQSEIPSRVMSTRAAHVALSCTTVLKQAAALSNQVPGMFVWGTANPTGEHNETYKGLYLRNKDIDTFIQEMPGICRATAEC